MVPWPSVLDLSSINSSLGMWSGAHTAFLVLWPTFLISQSMKGIYICFLLFHLLPENRHTKPNKQNPTKTTHQANTTWEAFEWLKLINTKSLKSLEINFFNQPSYTRNLFMATEMESGYELYPLNLKIREHKYLRWWVGILSVKEF